MASPTPGSTDSLFAAVRAWTAAHYPGVAVTEVVLVFGPTGQRVRLPVPVSLSVSEPPGTEATDAPGAPGARPSPAPASVHLRRVHRKLLEANTATPTPAKVLAVRAGYVRCNSHVRTALRELVRAGALRHTPDGYCLPGP